MVTRKSDLFLGSMAVGIGLLFVVCMHAYFTARSSGAVIRSRKALVQHYELTDLCLFTDARYTRHPAVADLMSPFQDHPMSLEHFPSGSILSPPRRSEHGLD